MNTVQRPTPPERSSGPSRPKTQRAWPVQAEANGGRLYRGNNVDQNFDNYSVEYTFADGSKMFHYGRTMAGCQDKFASFAQGSKGLGVISENGHFPAHARIYKGQGWKLDDKGVLVDDKASIQWEFPGNEPSPYQLEWDHLMDAIRKDKPFNEVKRGAEASLITSMGRMAAHTGQVITRDQMLDCPHEFAPDVDNWIVAGTPGLTTTDALGASLPVIAAWCRPSRLPTLMVTGEPMLIVNCPF